MKFLHVYDDDARMMYYRILASVCILLSYVRSEHLIQHWCLGYNVNRRIRIGKTNFYEIYGDKKEISLNTYDLLKYIYWRGEGCEVARLPGIIKRVAISTVQILVWVSDDFPQTARHQISIRNMFKPLALTRSRDTKWGLS